MELLLKYFPELTERQIQQFRTLLPLYSEWNQKINVVSRKDINELYLRHVLHSLGIAKVQPFIGGAKILDVGTGGGFPGIPLAILFPESQFYLVDSIGKKIKVVNEVATSLGLTNINASHKRAEEVSQKFDFIVSRAVTQMDTFVSWVRHSTIKKNQHELPNGILYLKGGDLSEELMAFPKARIFPLDTYFEESFFTTKAVVHLPLKFKG
jgi:16S rRNA (guanine527-N7)-methyltransferase